MLDNTVSSNSISNTVSWILFNIIDAPSFSQPYLCIQLPLQSPRKFHSSTLVTFHLPLPPLFVHKIIFTTRTTLPFNFNFTSSISYLFIFGYSHPSNQHQKHFPYLNHLANWGCLKGTLWSLVRTDTGLTSLFFLKVWQW